MVIHGLCRKDCKALQNIAILIPTRLIQDYRTAQFNITTQANAVSAHNIPHPRSKNWPAMGSVPADLVITGARVLPTYSDRISAGKEIWPINDRIAAIKSAGDLQIRARQEGALDAKGGILAHGLADPQSQIESAMITAEVYAEAALINGTMTIYDSHEIGNVMDVAGVKAKLKDARFAPMSIFLTGPSTVPATLPDLETAGGDIAPERIGTIFETSPVAVALGEKMDFVPAVMGDPRVPANIGESLLCTGPRRMMRKAARKAAFLNRI